MNDNYSDFLSLGSSLSGGEEKIEEVRVGLLGFERDVQGLKERVERERQRIATLVEDKRGIMKEISVGRGLLEIEERMVDLEVELGLRGREQESNAATMAEEEELDGTKEDWGEDWNDEGFVESDEEYEDDDESAVPPRLRRRGDQFLMVMALTGKFSPPHPFLVAEQPRVRKIRETLLLDLDAAIRAEPVVKGKARDYAATKLDRGMRQDLMK